MRAADPRPEQLADPPHRFALSPHDSVHCGRPLRSPGEDCEPSSHKNVERPGPTM